MKSQKAFLWALGFVFCLLLTSRFSYQAGLARGTDLGSSADPAQVPTTWTLVTATQRNWQDRVEATGNLTADPNRQSQVGAPAAGRISRVLVNVGDRVHRGQVLATIQSPETSKAMADAHHAQMRLDLAERTLAQRRRLAHLGDASRRPVEEARNEHGSALADRNIAVAQLSVASKKLARTRDLLEHGLSTQQMLEEDQAAVEECQARQRKAIVQLAVAQEHRHREEEVASSGLLIAPKILEAETEASLAREEMEHTRAALKNFGLSDSQDQNVPLRASTDGVVVQRAVSQGQWVSAEQELFQILDPSRLWLWVNLYEQDFPKVKVGMAVNLPELGLHGKVSYLPPQLESGTRTQRIRVEINNPGNLRVGMFTRAVLLIGPAHLGVAVPASSVQSDSRGSWVYVETGPDRYQPQRVELGLTDRQEGMVEIRSGLRNGQRLVSDGSYFLHSAASKSD